MDPKSLVMSLMQRTFNEGDLTAAEEYIHPEFQNHEAAAHRPPGPEGWRQTTTWIREAFEDLRWEVEDAIADRDKVVLRVRMSGRHTGPFMNFEPTGREFSARHIHIFRVTDGKISEHWANRDDLGMLAQLGLLPPPPTNPR